MLLGCGILVPLCPTPEIAQRGVYIDNSSCAKDSCHDPHLYMLHHWAPGIPNEPEKVGHCTPPAFQAFVAILCGCQCEAGKLGRFAKILPVLVQPSAKDIADIPGCREKGSIMRELTLTFFILSHWTWKY
jgi:hypothetical protein